MQIEIGSPGPIEAFDEFRELEQARFTDSQPSAAPPPQPVTVRRPGKTPVFCARFPHRSLRLFSPYLNAEKDRPAAGQWQRIRRTGPEGR